MPLLKHGITLPESALITGTIITGYLIRDHDYGYGKIDNYTQVQGSYDNAKRQGFYIISQLGSSHNPSLGYDQLLWSAKMKIIYTGAHKEE